MGAGVGLLQGGLGMIGANQAEKAAKGERNRARAEKKRLAGELEALENSRQPIINPYENVTDLSGQMSNPYANLGVATQAAEFQAEQAEVGLANTLDTLRATGASAGGATALAQAALASKKQISASLELQEASNQKLVAQGDEKLQQMQLAEKQRMQNADVMGKQFMFGATDRRENQRLNRAAGQLDNAAADERSANAAYGAAQAGKYGAASNMLGALGGAINPSALMGQGSSSGGGGGSSLNSGNLGIMGSDRRLKNNIKLISKSESGLNIYSFNYKDDKTWGKKTYQGVMSDEIPTEAVIKHKDGFDRVDYSKLDVEFKSI
jgi:hypothetical protein